MKLGCKCLNFIVEVETNLSKIVIEMTKYETTHQYFQKEVLQLTGNVNYKSEVYPSLVKSQVLGSWNIFECLSCHLFTNATNYVTGLETCSSNLNEVLDMKLAGKEERKSYSQVFQICIPTVLSIPENFIFNDCYSDVLDQRLVDQIDKKASDFFKMAEIKYQGSSNDQLLCLEDVKRRVLCEKKCILELLIKAKNEIRCNSGSMSYNKDINSSFLDDDPLSSPSLTNINSVDDLKESFYKLKVYHRKHERYPKYNAVEGMFVMDEDNFEMLEKNNETDSDSEKSCDIINFEDDIFDRHYPELSKEAIARSVPLDIPTLALCYSKRETSIDDVEPMEPEAIAASMKEMARNTRLSSIDVFGDLPRWSPSKDKNYNAAS